jgi:hypothetical protein
VPGQNQIEALLPKGFAMRQVTTFMGDVVVESTVTEIQEVSDSTASFEVPPDYREVPAPQPDFGALFGTPPG